MADVDKRDWLLQELTSHIKWLVLEQELPLGVLPKYIEGRVARLILLSTPHAEIRKAVMIAIDCVVSEM
jgi:hypothetical protein